MGTFVDIEEFIETLATWHPEIADLLRGDIDDLYDEFDREPSTKPNSNVFPKFHRTDPKTSRDAARDAYSRTGTHRYKAFTAIARSSNGLTWDEVVAETRINGIWKRLSELKQEGWIEASGTRQCKTGSDGTIFSLSARGRRWLKNNGRV